MSPLSMAARPILRGLPLTADAVDIRGNRKNLFLHTIIPAMPAPRVVGLIEFPEAGNVRLTASIVDTPVKQLRIGAQVDLSWIQAANANIPVFRPRNLIDPRKL
jgi:hypothetical protein